MKHCLLICTPQLHCYRKWCRTMTFCALEKTFFYCKYFAVVDSMPPIHKCYVQFAFVWICIFLDVMFNSRLFECASSWMLCSIRVCLNMHLPFLDVMFNSCLFDLFDWHCIHTQTNTQTHTFTHYSLSVSLFVWLTSFTHPNQHLYQHFHPRFFIGETPAPHFHPLFFIG